MAPRQAAYLLTIGLLFGSLALPAFGQAQGQNPNQGQGGGFGGGGGGGGFGGGGGQGGPGGGGGGGFGRFFGQNGQIDPTMIQQFLQQIEQRQLDNIKQELDCTDDEFTVLQPRIQKILQMQVSNTITQYSGQIPNGPPGQGNQNGQGGPGGQRGRAGFGGGGGIAAMLQAALPPNDLQAAAAALKMVLDDKDSSSELIAAKLAEYRAAKVTANDQLIEAQNDLKSLLTQRQEGVLVLQGLLN